MKRLAIVLSGLLLSGCATPQLIAGNEAGGMVSHGVYGSVNPTKAFAIADAHCHEFGKVARVSGRDQLAETLSFDCVTPSN